jgi:hypothetical protein
VICVTLLIYAATSRSTLSPQVPHTEAK